MANYFMSITNTETGDFADPDHVGSSTTAGDKVELRLDTTMTQRQVLLAMERFERWIRQDGLNGAGASLPPVR
jgi:hypothetical protein